MNKSVWTKVCVISSALGVGWVVIHERTVSWQPQRPPTSCHLTESNSWSHHDRQHTRPAQPQGQVNQTDGRGHVIYVILCHVMSWLNIPACYLQGTASSGQFLPLWSSVCSPQQGDQYTLLSRGSRPSSRLDSGETGRRWAGRSLSRTPPTRSGRQASTSPTTSIRSRSRLLSVLAPPTYCNCQGLRFSIFDIDNDSSNLNDHDNLGSAECSLAQILAVTNNEVIF